MSRGRNWRGAVDDFTAKMRGDNCSPATIETYRWLLIGSRAERFRTKHGVVTPADVDAPMFEAMKREFLADKLTASTVDDYCRVWRSFARFCLDRGWGVDARALMVRGPRMPKRIPATFSAEEEALLIGACRYPRNRVMVQLILETGLRRSEVAALTIDDIIETNSGWLLRVRQGKGRKDRGIPLSDEFAATLEGHIRSRPRTTCRALFLTLARHDEGDYAPLGSVGVYQVWRRLSQATGIKAYPHKGRHTAATRWAADGLVPWAIQRALGHSTLAMTNRYVDASAVDLQVAFKRRRVVR